MDKMWFFIIDDKKCLIITETKLPKNINSNLYNTFSDFISYILKKLKFLIESNCKDYKDSKIWNLLFCLIIVYVYMVYMYDKCKYKPNIIFNYYF